MGHYPTTAPHAEVECPTHGIAVTTDEHGRIAGTCPMCEALARRGIWRLGKRRQRAEAVA